MKKIVLGLIATVMFGFNFSFAQTLGSEHNRYLDVIYEKIKLKSKEDKSILNDKEKIGTILYHETLKFSKDSKFVNDKENLEEKIAEVILSAFAEDNFDLKSYNFSPKQQKYLNDILLVFDNEPDYKKAVIQFNSIDQTAKRELNTKEYETIKSTIDLTLHSSEYAYNNIEKWQNLSENSQKGRVDWGKVAGADCKGFIKGLFLGKPFLYAAMESVAELFSQIFF